MTDAKQRIAKNKRTRRESLNLGNCGLTEVPEEIRELVWLETLYLRNNERLTELAPLAGLTALRKLDASETQVSDLTPLAGLTDLQTLCVHSTQVGDLKPLAGLTALKMLDLRGTKASDLTPLAGLTALQAFAVLNTPVSDLTPLAGLTALEMLNLRATKVSDLKPLAGLTALKMLYLRGTKASDLTPLAALTGLQTLDVQDTQVSDLTPLIALIRRGLRVKWSRESWKGNGIYVEGCPLTNPPPEIVKQGTAAVLNYFAERAVGGVDHLYEAKMLILGEGGAGKTSLLRRLYQPGQPLPTEDETTRGISIHRHEFVLKNGRRFRLNVWS